MESYQQMQDKLRSYFDAEEIEKLEAIKNTIGTLGRHPMVVLLYSERNHRFASQQLANVMTGIDAIKRRDRAWALTQEQKDRLLDPNVDTSNSMLGELLVYAYLIDAFPQTSFVPRGAKKTPDFEVNHYLGHKTAPVFVEVHSKAWSGQMAARMAQVQEDFHSGKIGGTGQVRMAETVLRPFAGAKPDSHTEDGVSKFAQIGSKSCQFAAGHAGVLWLNLDQADLDMIVTTNDCLPLYSLGRGHSSSGIVWNALYGQKACHSTKYILLVQS